MIINMKLGAYKRIAILAAAIAFSAGAYTNCGTGFRLGEQRDASSTGSDGEVCCALGDELAMGPRALPVLTAAAHSAACAQPHELPIVTHWNGGRAPNASGQPAMGRSQAGACDYTYGSSFVPDVDRGVGNDYSIQAITNDFAVDYAEQACQRNGVPLRYLRPDAVAGGRVAQTPGYVQMVSGIQIAESMITVVLPPNWTRSGSYPVLFSGFYDINQNAFGLFGEGKTIIDLVAGSASGGGAIGVMWNGGGAIGSGTQTARSRQLINMVVEYIVANFAADRERLITFGTSRGGSTSLMIASNPIRNYRVRFAHAAVPPVKMGGYFPVYGATFPTVQGHLDTIIGLVGSWKPGWTHPGCGSPSLAGLNAVASGVKLTTGYSDPNEVNASHSLISDRFVTALRAAGTEVLLEIGSHDSLVPFNQQVEYAQKLRGVGVPVETHVMIKAGHFSNGSLVVPKLRSALATLMANSSAPIVNGGAIQFYEADHKGAQFRVFNPSEGFPFTLEVPQRMFAGQPMALVATGEPGTSFRVSIFKNGAPWQEVNETIGSDWTRVVP
ncbi:MAG TPA: hypothetical protein VFV50_13525, partial [Bdellovibrionales bacterium]|nr:hypothetical protein [Bdellovibrionales bacterium]